MHFELWKLGAISTSIASLNALMLFIYWRLSPSNTGVSTWIWSLVCWAVSYLLFTFRVLDLPIWFLLGLPNVMFFLALTLSLKGVCEFRRLPFPRLLVIGLGVGGTAWFIMFTYVWPDFVMRTMATSMVSAILLGTIAWKLLVPVARDALLSHRTAGCIYLLFVLSSLIRLLRGLMLPHAGDTVPDDPVLWGTFIFDFLMATPLTTFAMAMLIGQRQVVESRRLERELHEARVHLAEQKLVQQKKNLLRDLHDGLSGTIAAIGLNCGQLMDRRSPADSEDVLRAIRQLAAMSNQEIRSMINRAGSEAQEWSELQQEVRDFAATLLHSAGITLEWQSNEPPTEPVTDAAASACFTRMVKEALSNVLRHSGAAVARVGWEFTTGGLLLKVSDNGSGLTGQPRQGGHGLLHMRQRAAELGGEASYLTGEGLTVAFSLPLPLVWSAPEQSDS